MKKLLSYILSLFITLNSTGCSNRDSITKENDHPLIMEDFIDDTQNDTTPTDDTQNDTAISEEEKIIDEVKTITISAIGDCTLGRDLTGTYAYSLPYYLEINDYDYRYFFANVYNLLASDDLSIANLEGPLTSANVRADKKFAFKGDPSYTNILANGSIEVVNLANNHSMDYLETGYQDTITNLDEANISYFGNGIYKIMDVDGIRIGLAGIKGWDEDFAKSEIDKAKKYFDEQKVNFLIYNFHWGVEREYKQNQTQVNIAHYAIDFGGADLILGHHPHVLQGIEKYNDTYIIYSLANFVFGGNKNPQDKYTMIIQMNCTFLNQELTNSEITIIPATISSTLTTNNYQPTIADEQTSELILQRVLKSSTNFDYEKTED